MSGQAPRFQRIYRNSAGEAEFVESMIAQEEDFPATDKMPLEELPTTDFEDSVAVEDIDFDTMPADLQHDFESSTMAAVLQAELDKAPQLVEEKFFKEEWTGIDPLAEARRGMAAEEIDMSETSFSRFFEE